MKFSLTIESQIAVYGVSESSVEWINYMLHEGYKIVAYIDQRGDKIDKVRSIPIYTPDQWKKYENKEVIIIIMLQNARQHDSVAHNLHKGGFNKIIFCPMSTFKQKTNDVSKMKKIYNQCILCDFDKTISNIPEYSEMFLQVPKLNGIICRSSEKIVSWIPIELCYGSDVEWNNSVYTREAYIIRREYIQGHNLYSMKPYKDLFMYLRGERQECDLYLRFNGKRAYFDYENFSDEKLLTEKRKTYYLYLKELISGRFFQDTPANGTIASKGRVLIQDGLHRSVFLLMLGCHWLPVRISKNEMQLLGQKKVLSAIKKVIIDKDISKIENPIEHPHFHGIPVDRWDLVDMWGELSRELTEQKIKIHSVLDISITNAYFARNFIRWGITDAVCYIAENDNFTEVLNTLFYMEKISLINNICSISDLIKQNDFTVIRGDFLLENGVSFDFLIELINKGICIFDLPLTISNDMTKSLKEEIKERIKLILTYDLKGITMGMFLLQ